MKFITITLLFFSTLVCAESENFTEFFVGDYLLLGKGVDTDETYSGKTVIYTEQGHLKLKRMIGGDSITGDIAFEPALGGEAEVLRIRFQDGGKKYEQTCLWQTDLNNYPRISCYLYRPGVYTDKPGMEVMFHDRAAE